jgi:hypothetical protein
MKKKLFILFLVVALIAGTAYFATSGESFQGKYFNMRRNAPMKPSPTETQNDQEEESEEESSEEEEPEKDEPMVNTNDGPIELESSSDSENEEVGPEFEEINAEDEEEDFNAPAPMEAEDEGDSSPPEMIQPAGIEVFLNDNYSTVGLGGEQVIAMFTVYGEGDLEYELGAISIDLSDISDVTLCDPYLYSMSSPGDFIQPSDWTSPSQLYFNFGKYTGNLNKIQPGSGNATHYAIKAKVSASASELDEAYITPSVDYIDWKTVDNDAGDFEKIDLPLSTISFEQSASFPGANCYGDIEVTRCDVLRHLVSYTNLDSYTPEAATYPNIVDEGSPCFTAFEGAVKADIINVYNCDENATECGPSFNPDSEMNRAEFMKLVASAQGLDHSVDPVKIIFDDVSSDEWYYNSVASVLLEGDFEDILGSQLEPAKNVTYPWMDNLLTAFWKFTSPLSNCEFLKKLHKHGLLEPADLNISFPEGWTTECFLLAYEAADKEILDVNPFTLYIDHVDKFGALGALLHVYDFGDPDEVTNITDILDDTGEMSGEKLGYLQKLANNGLLNKEVAIHHFEGWKSASNYWVDNMIAGLKAYLDQ